MTATTSAVDLLPPTRSQGFLRHQKVRSAKRERLAEQTAALVVNKEWAQHGESVQASASSLYDMSASRRGGLRSHQGPVGRTLLQLCSGARQRGVKGRSTKNKAQLEAALT